MDQHTYIVSLDQLDDHTAQLVHLDPSGGPSETTLILRRGSWENMGRPATLRVDLSEYR